MFTSWPDLINALFELSGGFFVFLSVLQTLKDKHVAGVNYLTTAFFSSWGFWNVFYYFHLSQLLSWAAGILLAIMNLWWLYLILYYKKYPGGRDGSY